MSSGGLPCADRASPSPPPSRWPSAALVGVTAVADAGPQAEADVPVQLIAMNDFHGRISEHHRCGRQQITSPGPDGTYGTSGRHRRRVIVGGAAQRRLHGHSAAVVVPGADGTRRASCFVGAGDLISASPFESSVFKDEPTIEVLNAMGMDASSVGNHEFDRGTQELRRISAATDGTYTDDVTACEGIVAVRPAASATASTPSTAPTSPTSPPTWSPRPPASRCCRRTRSSTSRAARSSR